ncbi:hypothetical protein D3C78_1650870 [compost metagenome]
MLTVVLSRAAACASSVAAALSSSDASDLIYPKRYVTELAPRERLMERFHKLIHITTPEAVDGR